jgi:GT2 family glycosyltransferase
VSLSSLVSLIILTRNRKDELVDTLAQCTALDSCPPIIVVDDASTDGTVEEISSRFPDVKLIVADRNEGAAARNRGILAAETSLLAFTDDDSYFAPGSLERAVTYLDKFPDVAVIAARVLVGTSESLDPTCQAMADSPLGRRRGEPGPAILGFVGCGFVARKEALLQIGGFDETLSGVGAEESLIALDLAAAGWRLIYAPDVIVHHHPSPVRDRTNRRRTTVRNELLVTWMRRRPLGALLRTGKILVKSWSDAGARQGVIDAFRSAPRALSRRHSVPQSVERSLRRLDGDRT